MRVGSTLSKKREWAKGDGGCAEILVGSSLVERARNLAVG
jgi:hypothetical protein